MPPFFLSVFFFCFWVEEWCSFFPLFFFWEAKSLFRESCFIVLVSWAFFFPCQVIIFSAWSGGAHFFHLFFLPFFWVEGWCSFFSTFFFFFSQTPFLRELSHCFCFMGLFFPMHAGQVILFSAWRGGAHFFQLFFLPFFLGWRGGAHFFHLFFFKQIPFFV